MDSKKLLQLFSKSALALLVLVAMMGVQVVAAQTVYVSSTTGSDAFDGATPTISGGSGPKATLAAAYAAASAGNTISIEAGAYTENFDFGTATKGVSIEVRAAGAVTVATFSGTSTIAVTTGTITMTGGVGSVAVAGGAFTLTSGTVALGTGKLAFTAPTTLTVTGGRASGASPGYTGAVTANYTITANGQAGTEIPANLNGGTLTVAGASDITFPAALVAGSVVTAASATGTTTFSSAVTVSGAVTHNGDDIVFAALNASNGAISTSGLVGQTFTAGAFTATQNFAAQGGSITNAAPASMTLASVAVNSTIVGAGNSASDGLAYTITNSGTLAIAGAVTQGSATDANETDSAVIALTNSGTASIGASSSIAGVFNNTGGTLGLGSTTFTLTGAGPHVNMGTVTGAASTIVVSGASPVPASAGAAAPAYDIAGNLTVSGNGGLAGALSAAGNVVNSGNGATAGAIRVGGNLTLAGTGAMSGSIDVAGNGTFSGTTAFTGGAGTNDVDGVATFSGTITIPGAAGNLIIGSGSVTSTGSLVLGAGATLTSNGDFNTSNGGVFNANPAANSAADNTTLAFVIARGSSATFTAGPNTTIDDLTLTGTGASGTATLVLGQSVAIDENFTTGANTAVNLGNFLIRHTGTTAAALVGGNITTPAGQDGALAFEGATNTLSGLGNISNVLVNVGGGNRLSVLAATSIDFTGYLTLFTGGVTVAGGSDISPTGATAEIRRNAAAAAATTDIIGAGTVNGDNRTYILTIFGAGAVTAASELALTGVTTLNVNDTATYTADKSATVGNLNVAAGATLNLAGLAGPPVVAAQDITVTGVVTNAGVINGATGDQVILTGDNQTHSNTGALVADLSAQASGITVNGSATIRTAAPLKSAYVTNVIVGDGAAGTGTESLTLANIQQVDGTIAVASDGTLSIGLVSDTNAASGDNDEGSVDGAITVANGGSLTWTSNAIVDAAVTVGTAPIGADPTFNFNGFTVATGTAAANFSATSDAVLGTSGTFDANHTVAIGTNLDGAATPTSALPGLIVDAAASLSSATRVVGTTDVNATWGTGGVSLTLSGTVALGNTFTTNANVTITGTTVTLEGRHDIAGSLTHNATSIAYVGDGAAANDPDWLRVLGLYTQTAGDVSLAGVDLGFFGGITYTAGNYTTAAATGPSRSTPSTIAEAASMGGDFIIYAGGPLTVGATPFSVPNFATAAPLAIGAGDAVVVRDFLYTWALSGITVADVAAGTPGSLTLGDGVGSMVIYSDGGPISRAGALAVPGTVSFGAEVATNGHVIYDRNAKLPTTLELPSTFDTLTIKTGAAGTTFAESRAITVDNLVLDGGLDIENAVNNNNSLTVTAGGSVTIGLQNPFVGAFGESYAPAAATNYTLTYDNLATATETESWAAAWQPNVVIAPVTAGAGTVALHASRTASSLSIPAAVDVFALGANTLSVTGALTTASPNAITVAAGGSLAFTGTANQTITGGLNLTAVTVNNPLGVTLSGGNLNTSGVASGTTCPAASNGLVLTSGVITTGSNVVIICHTDTANQGYTRPTGGGVVFGNVEVVVPSVPAFFGTGADRVEFPLGSAEGQWRPFAITFNNPSQLGTAPKLTASYLASDPGGKNGFPIQATDDLNNPFEIGRYATDFHWKLVSAPSVTPNVDYDVEYRAGGFAGFAAEDIEKTRAIRRQDGNQNNFWIKVANGPADNDNYAVSATEPVLVARNAVGAVNTDGVLFAIGLENNLTGGAIADVTVNAGGTSAGIDLSTVFTGGNRNAASPIYTYAVANGDATKATGAVAGDVLTVTGVAAGTTTVTVTATDGFGASATSTVNVTVNAALAAGTDLENLAPVNLGAAAATVDGSVAHTGGTAPYTYAVATSDAAVATATVSTAGAITVTYVGVGTATITLTVTDALGSTLTDSFTVTVNSPGSAAGTLAAQTVENGKTVTQDVSGEFSGGTGGFTYTATSSAPATATVSVAGSVVTVTGVQPYVITAGAVTADAADVTVTVTATDAAGGTVASTYSVTVNPVLGNVDGSGGPSPASASLTLDGFLGLETLTAKQQLAANYNGDAAITPFDAALIFDAWLNPAAASKKEFVANPTADMSFGEVNRQATTVTIPVVLSGDMASAVAFSFETAIDPAYATVTGVTSNVEGWSVRHFAGEDGTLRIAGYGLEALTGDVVASISLELKDASAEFSLRGQGAVNNNPATEIEGIDVVELPENFALLGNYPNPFNPSTNISFDLPASADVSIEVYDMLGRRVMALPVQTIQAGTKRSVQLNGSALASGSYFYRVIAKMESKTQVETGRMLLVK